MSDLLLSDSDQSDLRFLLACEPVAGRPLPGREVLEHLARLVPCDAVGVVLAGPQAYVVDEVQLPQGHSATLLGSGCDGPLDLGVRHWARIPGYAEGLRADGLSDSIGLGFRNGRDCVARVWLDRRTGGFSPRDLLVLRLVAPHRSAWSGSRRLRDCRPA